MGDIARKYAPGGQGVKQSQGVYHIYNILKFKAFARMRGKYL